MRVTAKITAKGQTTIPRQVRELLQVAPGDQIVWETTPGGTVTVRRADPLDLDYLLALEASLGEWASQADEEAYREL